MELGALLARLAGEDRAEAIRQPVEGVVAALPVSAPLDWRQLAAGLAYLECEHEREAISERCRVLGISGGQGAGKSTLAALLVQAMMHLGRRAASLSLDDFYLTRSERVDLAHSIHPLLATRGVPGTHDVTMACAVIDQIRSGDTCSVPAFDKVADDRRAEGRTLDGPIDLLIFEGWCVGARAEPEAALVLPVNELERLEDQDAGWRCYVNDQLANRYADLWARLDRLLYLQVPDIGAVIRWRTLQEQAHPESRRMSGQEIERFVAHYERLTCWMRDSLGGEAELVGLLDENHDLAELIVRKP